MNTSIPLIRKSVSGLEYLDQTNQNECHYGCWFDALDNEFCVHSRASFNVLGHKLFLFLRISFERHVGKRFDEVNVYIDEALPGLDEESGRQPTAGKCGHALLPWRTRQEFRIGCRG